MSVTNLNDTNELTPEEEIDRIILVTGATGQQGSAVARHLLAQGWTVRAMTRNPNSDKAKALAQAGAEVVAGDLNKPNSLVQPLNGVYGVFSVQSFREAGGAEGEVRQGKTLVDAAKVANVQHFIYSSVGGADRTTGIPHFESKWTIEQYARKQLPGSVSVLRPVFFMENLPGMIRPLPGTDTYVLSLPMVASKRLQMIATDDIGAFAAIMFADPVEYIGRALEIAGDALTMPQVADKLSAAMGKLIRYEGTAIRHLRKTDKEMADMFQWFNDEGYHADIPELRHLYPALMTLDAWLRKASLAPVA